VHTQRRTLFAVQVYRLMLLRTSCVQPLSCDEAFMDITGALVAVAKLCSEYENHKC